uniref:EF-hand calcium binding domain 11 n=1 Tax=Strigops habroptila TaxID=2489341 RepID=A0A672TR70_STRHB
MTLRRKWEENRSCDQDNNGYLIREDLKGTVVMFFGYKPLKVYTFFHLYSEDPAYIGLLFEKFLNLMSTRKAARLHSNETRQIFTAFDVQDTIFFTFEDFNRAFNSISTQIPEKIIVEAFREVDQDSDGCISFKEFESAMNKA